MKSVGQGSLARESKLHLFREKVFLNPVQVTPTHLQSHLLRTFPCPFLNLFCTVLGSGVPQLCRDVSPRQAGNFFLKYLMPQWLTRPQLTGPSGAGIQHRHRPALPEGCGSWSCGAASHGSPLCASRSRSP